MPRARLPAEGRRRVCSHVRCLDHRSPLWHLWLQLAAGRTHALGPEPCLAGLSLPWLTPPSITPAFGPLPQLSTASLCCSHLVPAPKMCPPPNPRRDVLSPILVMGGPCVAGESGPWGFFLFSLLHVWVPQPQVVGSGFKAANSLSLRKMKLPLELTLRV